MISTRGRGKKYASNESHFSNVEYRMGFFGLVVRSLGYWQYQSIGNWKTTMVYQGFLNAITKRVYLQVRKQTRIKTHTKRALVITPSLLLIIKRNLQPAALYITRVYSPKSLLTRRKTVSFSGS